MTVYDWRDVRAAAIERGFDTPWPDTEHDIVAAFKQDPQRVIAEIDAIAGELAKGRTLRAPWAVLRKRLAAAPAAATVDVDDRAAAVQRAERLVRNQAGAIDDEYELAETLFGAGGVLEPWRGDAVLRGHMVALWAGARDRLEARREAVLAQARDAVRPAAMDGPQ